MASKPVTVTSAYQVAPEQAEEFAAWATTLFKFAHKIPGCLGGGIISSGRDGGEWHVVYRFSDKESALAWESSFSRTRWESIATPFAQQTSTFLSAAPKNVSDGPPRNQPPPPKWKLWLVNLAAVFPPILLFNVSVAMYVQEVNVLLRTLGLCLAVTAAVTWVLMPRLQRLLKQWLYPSIKNLSGRHRGVWRSYTSPGPSRSEDRFSAYGTPPRVSRRAAKAYR